MLVVEMLRRSRPFTNKRVALRTKNEFYDYPLENLRL